ncbi:MAG TPA: hypothetical protein VHC70_03160 [Phycisphaerales bacterium]|jgi:hypothetical protein|nr:hypothetical protein [Phycisphaerales bacterium]
MSRPISKRRFTAAIIIAIISDAVSVWTEFTPPVQWVVDGVTAVLLLGILGWRWQLLPALVAEAIPWVAAFPSWVLVVVALRAGDGAKAPPTVEPSGPHAPRKHVRNTADATPD